jgi:hypothetical protein
MPRITNADAPYPEQPDEPRSEEAERFVSLTKRLVRVPKKDIDEEREREEDEAASEKPLNPRSKDA